MATGYRNQTVLPNWLNVSACECKASDAGRLALVRSRVDFFLGAEPFS